MLRKIFKIVVYIFAAIGFVLVGGYFAVRFGFTNERGIIDTQRAAFLQGLTGSSQASVAEAANGAVTDDSNLPWPQTQEWQVLSAAITRDHAALTRAGGDAGVSPRLIAADLVAEQLRLFFTERAFYKQFFYPLKILGAQTQFSWGVMGMKEDTAVQVENNLKDPSSPFYPGDQYAHLLDYPATTTDVSAARFARMTDQHDHYWSYLYAGLYLKEIEAQWQKAGYPIADKPAILSTLYNIGFQHSNPNPNPQVGGAAITIGPATYSFGGLAADFYNSNLLTNVLPR